MGRFRRVIAGLLALVLLALPGTAIRHASAATPALQQAAGHCTTQGEAGTLAQGMPTHAVLTHAAVSTHGHGLNHGPPCGEPGGQPDLACCVAAQCPSAIGALLPALAGPQPSSAAVARYLAPAHAHFGIEVPPSLPPPRRVA